MHKELFSELKENIFSPLGVFGIMLFIGMIMFGFIFKSGLSDISILTNAQGITVSGTAEKFVTSDRGSISLNLETDSQGISDKNAVKRLSDARDSLIKYLINNGIESKDIDVLSYTSYPECTNRDKNNWDNCLGIKYNQYNQVLNVSSNDVAKVKDLSLNLNSYLNSEAANNFNFVTVSVQSTQYFYSKFSDVKSEMLNEATKNAFERAEAIAKSTNNHAGAVITASQGVFQVTSKDNIDSQDYGVYDTSTVDKKITAVVRVSFKVK